MQSPMHYEITVEGCPGEDWSSRFEVLHMASDSSGHTIGSGPVGKQAALHGLLARVRDLGQPHCGPTHRIRVSSAARPPHVGAGFESFPLERGSDRGVRAARR
jgi:hypothetical protein